MEEGRSFGGTEFLFGLLVGAVMGAALAIIFAPQSGEETRAMLKAKSDELQLKAKEMTDTLRQDAEELVAKVSQVLKETTEQVKGSIGKVMKEKEKPAEA